MKISGFEKIISVDTFVYLQTVDRHIECRFTVSVDDKELVSCTNQLGESCSIEHDDSFNFTGIVTEICVEEGIYTNRLDVTVCGATVGFDNEEKSRVFQNKEKKISDILEKIGMSGVSFKAKEDNEIEEIIVQSKETDWDFAVRIARYLGYHTYPCDSTWIGNPLDETLSVDERDVISCRFTLRKENSECVCILRKKIKFGQKVSFRNKTFFADTIRCEKIKEEYVTQYHLSEYPQKVVGHELSCYTLYAEVTDNDDKDRKARIRVKFEEPFEDVMSDNAMWIETDSMWASKDKGIVCVPLIGDIVIVNITGKLARVSASRRIDAVDVRCRDCNGRYIFFNDKNYAEFDKDKMLISFNDKKVELTMNNEGILLVCEKDSVKIGMGMIKLKTDKTNIEISSGTTIGTSALEIDGNSKIAMKATKVSINGTNGVSLN